MLSCAKKKRSSAGDRLNPLRAKPYRINKLQLTLLLTLVALGDLARASPISVVPNTLNACA
jgi:hypothetical protein